MGLGGLVTPEPRGPEDLKFSGPCKDLSVIEFPKISQCFIEFRLKSSFALQLERQR